MTFGISAGTAALIGGGLSAAGAIGGALISSNGAQSAANTQSAAANAGVAEQQYQFQQMENNLNQYNAPGYEIGLPGYTSTIDQYKNALTGYQGDIGQYKTALGGYNSVLTNLNNLTGANGNAAQQTAINGLKSNPLYTSSMQLGQQAILANASATGGLRGGNTIASLGYLPNQILSNVMGTQISNLGTSLNGEQGAMTGASGLLNADTGTLNALGNQAGMYGNLISTGENAAAMVGNAGLQTGNNITNLLGQSASAQAGATLATTNATTGAINNIASSLGSFLNPSSSSPSSYSFALPAYLNAGGISSGGSSPAGLYGTGAGMF